MQSRPQWRPNRPCRQSDIEGVRDCLHNLARLLDVLDVMVTAIERPHAGQESIDARIASLQDRITTLALWAADRKVERWERDNPPRPCLRRVS
jgi:hypothetical protein